MTANEYTSFFKDSKNSQIKGETSVFYLYSKDAFLEIKEYNENMKIIIMLRHPVDFLISYHQDALYVGIENEPDFWKALDLEKNRKQGLNIPITNNFEKGLYYSELIDYATHIEKFMKTFKNNVKVILFEEFFSMWRTWINNKPMATTATLLWLSNSRPMRFEGWVTLKCVMSV